MYLLKSGKNTLVKNEKTEDNEKLKLFSVGNTETTRAKNL